MVDGARRAHVAGAGRGAPRARRALDPPPPGAAAAARGASRARLPVHLLLPPPRPAGAVAPGPGSRAARCGGVPRRPRARPPARRHRRARPGRAPRPPPDHRRVRPGPAGRHRLPRAPAELLRAARVGDGLPDRQRGRAPARRGAAAAGRRRHRRRRRVAARALHPPRRVPVLHRRRAPPQRRLPHPRRPGRARAARLPARDDGPLQVGLQARPRHPRRAAGRLLRPRRGRPHPRHAREPLRPGRPRLPAGADRDPGRPRRVRPRPGRLRPPRRAPARPARRAVHDDPGRRDRVGHADRRQSVARVRCAPGTGSPGFPAGAANAATGGHEQTRLRSPWAPSTRRTGGHTLRSCTPGVTPVG